MQFKMHLKVNIYIFGKRNDHNREAKFYDGP